MALLGWFKGGAHESRSHCHDPLLIVVTGRIYSWDGRKVELRGGSGVVHCVAQCRSAVYGGEMGSISNYASGPDFNAPVLFAPRGSVTAMCLHDDVLYDASTEETRRFEIRKALIGDLMATRPHPISAMASNGGTLFDGGGYGVFETIASTHISELVCDAMCSHDGRLLVASGKTIRDAHSNEVIGRASGRITAMCSYRGRLMHADFGGEGIRDTLDQRLVVSYEAIDKLRGRSSKSKAVACLFPASDVSP